MTDPRNKYTSVWVPTEKRVRKVHRLRAERALGRPLRRKEQVHHHEPGNDDGALVICPDIGYHKLLHVRTDALRESGNANWRRCYLCREYDDPAIMVIRHKSVVGVGRAAHLSCERSDLRRRRSM